MTEVFQKQYLEEVLNIVKICSSEFSDLILKKYLSMIQSWAFEYSSDRNFKDIAEFYMTLKDEGIEFPNPTEDDLKEADSEDMEAFFNAHEDENESVLNNLESILEKEEKTTAEISEELETTSCEFNNFLQKRVVQAEIESFREKLRREVEEFPHDDDIKSDFDPDMLDDENEIMLSDECNIKLDDSTSSDFQKFLSNRAEAVNNSDPPL